MKRIEAISGGNARQVNVVSLATAISAIKSSIHSSQVPAVQTLLNAGFEVRIQLRRDTSSNWAEVAPILGEGEVAISTDTGRFKIGDGSSVWTALPYADEHAIAESQEAMQASLPCPTSISQSRVYQTNNLQIGFSDPIELSDDGSIEIDGEGSLYEV